MDFSVRVAIETILDQLEDDKPQNIIVSPASLDITLRTAACGAKGETLEQMLRYLGAKDINELNSKASSTMEALGLSSPENNDPPLSEEDEEEEEEEEDEEDDDDEEEELDDYEIEDIVPAIVSCANAIWIDEQHSVKDSFKKLVNDVYRAEINNVNLLQVAASTTS